MKYANFRLSKVAKDFPSLSLDYNSGKQAKNSDVDTDYVDTGVLIKELASR